MYAQIIDDEAGTTLVAASTMEKDVKAELKKTNDVEAAAYVGTVIAKRALEKGIKEVVFDRGGFIYQGKVAALAENHHDKDSREHFSLLKMRLDKMYFNKNIQ